MRENIWIRDVEQRCKKFFTNKQELTHVIWLEQLCETSWAGVKPQRKNFYGHWISRENEQN